MVPQVRPPATDGAADPRMSTSPPPGGSSGPWTTRAPTTGAVPARSAYLRPRAFIQPTLGTKRLQGRVSDLPTRFGSFVLLERRRRLLPGAVRRDRRARIVALLLRLRDPAIGRFGVLRTAVPRGSRSRGDVRRASWVVWNTSRPFSNGGFPSCCRCCCTAAIPACRPVPASARTYESAGKSCNARDQVDPVRSLAFSAQEPDHARRLNAHQHRATVEEDLIEAADQHQRLTLRIEVLQDPPRRDPGGFDPAVQRGSTGACLHAHDQRQQDEDLIEAQAHGRGRDSELVLLVRGKLDGLSQPFPERAFS